jgi:hypothetical protein
LCDNAAPEVDASDVIDDNEDDAIDDNDEDKSPEYIVLEDTMVVKMVSDEFEPV